MFEVEAICGHTVPLQFALKASTAKPLICEACFVRNKRREAFRAGHAVGGRIRYLVPSKALPKIPLRGTGK